MPSEFIFGTTTRPIGTEFLASSMPSSELIVLLLFWLLLLLLLPLLLLFSLEGGMNLWGVSRMEVPMMMGEVGREAEGELNDVARCSRLIILLALSTEPWL